MSEATKKVLPGGVTIEIVTKEERIREIEAKENAQFVHKMDLDEDKETETHVFGFCKVCKISHSLEKIQYPTV